MLVTAGQDDVVKVWDLCDGEEIGQLRGHRGESMIICDELVIDSTFRDCQNLAGRRYFMSDRRC